MASTTKTPTVHLDERANPEGRVLVTAQDEDRFIVTCAQAVAACKMQISNKVWFDELDALLVRVRDWSAQNSARVHAVYASPREGRIVIFVIPKSDQYDLELGNKLTDLDMELAQNFQIIDTEVMQVPGKLPDQLATFVNVESAKRLHG